MKATVFLRLTAVFALLGAMSVTAWADDKERNAEPLEFREITDEVLLRNDVDLAKDMRRLILENDADFFELFVDASTVGGSGQLSVNFRTEYVLGVALKESDRKTVVRPVAVKQNNDYLYFYYSVKKGEKRSYKLPSYCLVALKKPVRGRDFHIIFKQVN